MKKILYVLIPLLACGAAKAQNGLYTTVYTNGPLYAAATSIGANGYAIVAAGGNWVMAGDITSLIKGNNNSPAYTGNGGYGEIDFFNTGTVTNGATTAGAASATNAYIIDAYAGASGQAANFVLPIGANGVAYPLTAPAGNSTTAAYFPGSGSTQSTPVTGNGGTATTEYSPYYDLPAGLQAATYTFSYPSGFAAGPNSSLLQSNNTSVNGTSGSTTYSLLANVANFSTSASSVSITTTSPVNSGTGTQVYFANSSMVLPVTLTSFSGLANGCTADLSWATSTESNSSYYAVEASLDGSSFGQVGKVASKNSPTGASYAFSYPLGSGTDYFRLRAVDNDGRFTYSGTVAVTGTGACGGGLLVKVSPNPTSNIVNVQGLASGSRLSLINLSGQKLTEATASGTMQAISLAGYAKGVYILRIQAADGTVTNVKVVKQ